MEDDESKKHTVDTVPPPPDADDAYSAETKVGMASAELLEAVRRAEEGALGERASPPPAKPASVPPPPAPKGPSTPPPAPKVASVPPPRSRPIDTPRSPRVSAEPARQPSGLPPVVAIPLVFLAVSIVLAAVVR